MVRRLVCPALVVAGLAGAVPASAATLHVAQNGGTTPGCPQSSPCRLSAAIAQADAAQDRDTLLVLGALADTGSGAAVDLSQSPIELIGSGRAGGTVIARTGNPAVRVGLASAVSGAELHSAGGAVAQAVPGAVLRAVNVRNSGNGDGVSFVSAPGVSVLEDVDISAPNGTGVVADLDPSAQTFVRDSTIAAPTGLALGRGNHQVQRSTIRSTRAGIVLGTLLSGGRLDASSSVIRMEGDGGEGVDLRSTSDARLRQLTVDGVSVSGATGGVAVSGSAEAIVRGSIVRGFAADLRSSEAGRIEVGTTDYATTAGFVDPSPGGNVNLDPAFFDRPGGDYRLRHLSPLLDAAGDDTPVAPESATDRLNSPRLADGDGDGVVRRDMGALEYRRPVAALSVPAPQLSTIPITLQAGQSAYPEAPLTRFQWDLDDDGSFETDTGPFPQVTRLFVDGGRFNVRLRVTGADGAIDDDVRPLVVFDRHRPRFVAALMTNRFFATGYRRTAIVARARLTTTFRYTLSEPANVRFVIEQAVPGRRVGRACLPALPFRRLRPPCPRYAFRGALMRLNRPSGANWTFFNGRIGLRPLAIGRYRASLIAYDRSRNVSFPRRLLFSIVAPNARVPDR